MCESKRDGVDKAVPLININKWASSAGSGKDQKNTEGKLTRREGRKKMLRGRDRVTTKTTNQKSRITK